MKLVFLQASVPLTKTFTKTVNGAITKSSYPSIYEFTSHEEEYKDLRGFEQSLKSHAAKGHCLLKGIPSRALNCESRAGTTDSIGVTDWVCLDIDGLRNVATVEALLKALGLNDISYILQWSASFGIENNDLRCHIYMLLDKPQAAPLLKQWLVSLNHSVQILNGAMSLTKTGNSIRWPLDISACQNDKLIYITPPVLKGICDPLGKNPRIKLVKHTNDRLVLPTTIASPSQNRALTNSHVNALRVAVGLPTRKFDFKLHGSMEVMVKPDSCAVTDMKIERGFVYFNLNGGDSWGYYHPENNPDYIHNFKGEPSYLTKELLPEYWHQLTQSTSRSDSRGVIHLAFCDRRSGVYWRGTYNTPADLLDIYPAKNETQIKHFAKQHGMPLGDYIPEWDLCFDPHDNVRVDTVNRTVNTFQPTKYMQAVAKKVDTCPKTIFKIIHHALGSDANVTEHFMNWLAYIVQFRDRAKTAWVLHGTQGTGKGVLMNRVLRPLFGETQTATRQMDALSEPYNDYLQSALIVFVDEVQIKALVNEDSIVAKIKNFITEEVVAIRRMYSNAIETKNYSNWIFASNMPDPIAINKNDRRFNVGRYQPNKLLINDKELQQVEQELQSFHDFLLYYPCDKTIASTPLITEDREDMINLTESSADKVAAALKEGDFEFFVGELPTTEAYVSNALEYNRVENYKEVLCSILDRTSPAGKCNISRDELRTIFDYTVGNVPSSPNKFTAYLRHRRIKIIKVWIDRTVNGLVVDWRDAARFKEYNKILRPQNKAKAKSR